PRLLAQEGVREGALRVAIAEPRVGVRRERVLEPVQLLHVLAVVALLAGEAEEPLLEERIAAVPQREGEAQVLAVVAQPADPVLAPAVGARPRVVERERGPRLAVGGVVLAHRAPGAEREVGTPS